MFGLASRLRQEAQTGLLAVIPGMEYSSHYQAERKPKDLRSTTLIVTATVRLTLVQSIRVGNLHSATLGPNT